MMSFSLTTIVGAAGSVAAFLAAILCVRASLVIAAGDTDKSILRKAKKLTYWGAFAAGVAAFCGLLVALAGSYPARLG